ncbi:hypothetical protein AVEN_177300-1 [Araneus ventricosus]|uniref:ATP-dependent DNA helicase PIF1 n=1 Tax=Araneus ventricosus TaxID=182803 RepID=A0A4Y2C4H9_ARAVE|nr:hypothetical protein AVEN_177300-1 [Araneus ventricosus]
MPNIIEATIKTGYAAGEDVFIPRMQIIPSDFPFQFKHIQFTVRLSFAMNINKAQEQSLKDGGLDLHKPRFSHVQLYVGCSRVGKADNLYILAPNGRTTNIFYPEAQQRNILSKKRKHLCCDNSGGKNEATCQCHVG